MLQSSSLNVTRDHSGMRNPLATRVYSTGARLGSLLYRSTTLALFDVYNTTEIFLIRESRVDMELELADLKRSPSTSDTMYPHEETQVISQFFLDNKDATIRLIEFLMGKTNVPPNIENGVLERMVSNNHLCGFVKFKIFAALARLGSAPKKLTIKASQCHIWWDGMCKRVEGYWSDEVPKYVTFTAEDVAKTQGTLTDTDTFKYFIKNASAFHTESLDQVLALLGALCVDTDQHTLMNCGDEETDIDTYEKAQVLRKLDVLYGSADMQSLIRVYGRIDDYLHHLFHSKWWTPRYTVAFIRVIAEAVVATRLPLGPVISRVIKHFTEKCSSYDKALKISLNYLTEVLNNPNAESQTSSVALESFRASPIYNAKLDVKSIQFIPFTSSNKLFAAVPELVEPPKLEDVKTEEPASPTLEEPPAVPEETEADKKPDGELQPSPTDKAKPVDLPPAKPEDQPAQDGTPPVADDGSGTTGDGLTPVSDLTVPPTKPKNETYLTFSIPEKDTMQSFLYRKEVLFLIESVVKIDPQPLAAEDVALLKKLKCQYLFVLSVDDIDTILHKIIKFPIKVKKPS